MEAGLAVIASLFAIIQGSVWLIHGIQNYRAERLLREPSSASYPLKDETQEFADTAYGTSAPLSSVISIPDPKSAPHSTIARSVLPLAGPTVGLQELGNSKVSTSATTFAPLATPRGVVDYRRKQSRFGRILHGVWHAILIAFLPIFSIATPLGLVMIVLFPFRSSIADPTIYSEESPWGSLILASIFVIPGIVAFRHRPISSVHKWVRRISMVISVLLGVLFFCLLAFVEPS